jgi:hypothetical protein
MRTAELFRFCVGKEFVIRDFGRYGHLELETDDDPRAKREFGLNSIWLEPELVKLISRTQRKVSRPMSGLGWKEDLPAATGIEAKKKGTRSKTNKGER